MFFSTTFRLIPPQLSLMGLLFMNMKDIILLMVSWSSLRYNDHHQLQYYKLTTINNINNIEKQHLLKMFLVDV